MRETHEATRITLFVLATLRENLPSAKTQRLKKDKIQNISAAFVLFVVQKNETSKYTKDTSPPLRLSGFAGKHLPPAKTQRRKGKALAKVKMD